MRRVSVSLLSLLFLYGSLQAQNPSELFKFSKNKYEKKDYLGSLDFLNKALAEDPKFINAYFLRSEVYYSMGQYYSSVQDINSIFKIEKDVSTRTYSYLMTRGKSFLALKDYINASKDFEESYALFANNDELYYYRAKMEMETRNYKTALDDLQLAIQINADKPEFYALRSEIKMLHLNPIKGSENYRSILSDLNLAIALSPDTYYYYELRGKFLKSMGDVDEAISDFNKMIELSPNKETAYTELGLIKMNNYEYRRAAYEFTKSITINPKDERNYRYRGLCNNNMNNYSEAFKDFSKSIDLLTVEITSSTEKEALKNTLAETYLLRGHCLNLMGNNAQACRDFLMASNLGVRKGLNYYRKYCGIY